MRDSYPGVLPRRPRIRNTQKEALLYSLFRYYELKNLLLRLKLSVKNNPAISTVSEFALYTQTSRRNYHNYLL